MLSKLRFWNNLEIDANAQSSLETIDIFVGPLLRYVTPVSNADNDFCLIEVAIPSGVTVPIRSHADRETFYILSGELQGMTDGQWKTFRAGDVLDITGGIRHAIRNASSASMTLLLVTTMKLGRFFRDVGRPASGVPLPPPTPADLQRFMSIATDYGYWMGSLEDNAAVGIAL